MLITGTSRGIGRTLVERYTSAGYRVVGCSRNPVDRDIERYEHVPLDVTDERAVSQLFAHIRSQYSRLDVLINNAGIASMNHALLTPMRAVRSVYEINVFSMFLFCREAAKLMQRRRGGRIVNTSTVAVALDLEGEAAYASSKAAVESLTRILAREFAHFGITVNAVGPSPIDTDLIRGVPATKIDDVLARTAIKHKALPDDVGNVIDFFISPASSQITGQVLYLGGV